MTSATSRSKLLRQLTLVATLEGSPVGFASLEGKDKIDMLYVHPAATGQGVGAMLVDALEKLAGARGAAKLAVDASDSARGFFEKRGYVTQQRNTVSIGDEWLANTTLHKQACRQTGGLHDQARHAVSASLALLHRAQIRRARSCRPIALYVVYRSPDGIPAPPYRAGVIACRREALAANITCGEGMAPNAFISSTPRCATARRPTASISRSPTSWRSLRCWTNSASTTSRAAIRAPIRPTPSCSARIAGLNTTFTAFGMTRRPGRSASNDPGLAALLEAKADAICFVAKSWDYHVKVALETTDEENLASIRDSVRAAKAKGREVLLDCEHFFDGYKANPNMRWLCAKARL